MFSEARSFARPFKLFVGLALFVAPILSQQITQVWFIGTPANPLITITGTGFGSAPASTGSAFGGTGLDYGTALHITDFTTSPNAFDAGQDNPAAGNHDAVGLANLSYSDAIISYNLGSEYTSDFYPSVFSLNEGDQFTAFVGGISFSGTVHYNIRAFQVSMDAFIEPDTVEGPGILFAPIANDVPYPAIVPLAVLGEQSGITCGIPNFYGTEVETLRFSGNNRSFKSNATSYKFQQSFVLGSDASAYPKGLVGTTSVATVPSKSWAPNAIGSDGVTLTPEALGATLPTRPSCNLLFYEKTPDVSNVTTTTSREDVSITAHLVGQVGDPLIADSKKINQYLGDSLINYIAPVKSDLTLVLDLANNTYHLTGSHTCYPAFEFFLDNNLIYSFEPTSDTFLQIAKCLAAGLGSQTVDRRGAIP